MASRPLIFRSIKRGIDEHLPPSPPPPPTLPDSITHNDFLLINEKHSLRKATVSLRPLCLHRAMLKFSHLPTFHNGRFLVMKLMHKSVFVQPCLQRLSLGSCLQRIHSRSQIHTSVSVTLILMRTLVLWDVTPCKLELYADLSDSLLS